MAGDSGESCIITKDVERMLEFSMAQVAPQEETGPQPSFWNPIPEGRPLGADIQGARSYAMCCMRPSLRGP